MSQPLDAGLAAWIGRSTTSTDIVTRAMVDGLLALLDHDTPVTAGSEAPQGIHWLCATPRVRARDIGADGHPHHGLILPPVDLPRRMWAGSAIEFVRPLRQGDAVERRSTIRAITPKMGSAGPLVFVDLDHEIRANDAIAVHERHTIVFRHPPELSGHGKREGRPEEPMSEPPAFSRTVAPDPVMLFRYSALTFNSHRIHFDHPYVTQSEGYPGLVVHGPLIATLLLDLVAGHHGSNALKTFSFRGLAPAFANEPLALQAFPRPGGVHLRAVSGDGRLVVTAEAAF